MSSTLNDILNQENGAAFYTGDIHVHSYKASSDVKDSAATIEALIDAAVAGGISILSITDHNNDAQVSKSLAYGAKYLERLLVVPGVEISTPQGHLLVYCDPATPTVIGTLLAKIDLIGQKGERDTRTSRSMVDVIAEAHKLGAISIAAHIDRVKTGFEMLVEGYPPWKGDVLSSPGLYALDFDNKNNLIWFSPDDEKGNTGGQRMALTATRRGDPAIPCPLLGAIQNSDAHTLADFTTKRSLTRYKMTRLDFNGFRTALIDAEARVRAVASVPPVVPKIIGMSFVGGFLDKEICHFSPNLNSFIGGRGTGKSTAVQSLAYGLGLNDQLEQHDNCPDNVVVYCEDSNGVRYCYQRDRCMAVTATTQSEDGSLLDAPPNSFRVEFYKQNDLSEVARDPLKTPSLLQNFLDRHLILDDLINRERSLVQDLGNNSAQLKPLEAGAVQLNQRQRDVVELDKKLKIAEEGKLKEVAAAQAQVGAEKSFVTTLKGVATQYESGVSLSNAKKNYPVLRNTVGDFTPDKVVLEAFAKSEEIIRTSNEWLAKQEVLISTALKEFSQHLKSALHPIGAQHLKWDARISEKLKELRAQGLSGSVNQLQQLVDQRQKAAQDVAKLTSQQTTLEELRTTRRDLLQALSTLREEIADRRRAQVSAINETFKQTIQDYVVVLYYEASGITSDFQSLVEEVMHGSFMPDVEIGKMCAAATPMELSDMVRRGDTAGVAKLGAIGTRWATEVICRFQSLEFLHRLETTNKPPCPVIKVITKSKPQRPIPVNQLSDGQKHTILLTIAMLGESNDPLIIDQPEDDLDNAFIFTSVVKALRYVKERRQVILVTHNANIAVLGDSELILPMKRDGDAGKIYEHGAIDRPETKQAVQDVLEGGTAAFLRRKAMYGI
jgi:hypothetical protein